MPATCLVPCCKSGSRTLQKTLKKKISFFKVPKNKILKKKWEQAIPGVHSLRENQVICINHFSKECVIDRYIQKDNYGNIIINEAYQRPRLKENAVPSIFNKYDKVEKVDEQEHNYCRGGEAKTNNCETEWPVENTQFQISLDDYFINEVESTLQTHVIEEIVFDHVHEDFDNIQNNNGCDVLPDTQESSTTKNKADEQLNFCLKIDGIRSTICINDNEIKLSNKWGLLEKYTNYKREIVFLHVVSDLNSANVLEKQVILRCCDITMRYFVHGIEVTDSKLPQKLYDPEQLINILFCFEKMKICKGITNVDIAFIKETESYKDNSYSWRHKNCTVLSKHKKCLYCSKLSKLLSSRKMRFNGESKKQKMNLKFVTMKRKILCLNEKLKREKQLRKISEKNIISLEKSLQQSNEKIADMKKEPIENICNDFKISETQKTTLKEIINASKHKSKGHRYSDEWLMLCMLLNTRSSSVYEFLRKTDAIPLPCTRTLRSYFSSIDSKSVFDTDLAQKKA